MASDLAPDAGRRGPVRKRDRHHLISPLGNRFRCLDDRWIILNMPEVRWWGPFCKTVERAELLEDERFVSVKDRFDNMPALIEILDEVMATKTLAEWGRIFDDAGLIWGPASSIDELANDPQAAAIGLFPTIEHPEGAFRTVAAPMRITGADIRPRGPAPALGGDTDAVLARSATRPTKPRRSARRGSSGTDGRSFASVVGRVRSTRGRGRQWAHLATTKGSDLMLTTRRILTCSLCAAPSRSPRAATTMTTNPRRRNRRRRRP